LLKQLEIRPHGDDNDPPFEKPASHRTFEIFQRQCASKISDAEPEERHEKCDVVENILHQFSDTPKNGITSKNNTTHQKA
jgi:hypothetical protein